MQLQIAAEVTNAIEAELIKNLLEDNNIRCMIDGEHQAALAGSGIPIRILVNEEVIETAHELVGEFYRQQQQHTDSEID